MFRGELEQKFSCKFWILKKLVDTFSSVFSIIFIIFIFFQNNIPKPENSADYHDDAALLIIMMLTLMMLIVMMTMSLK